MKFSDIQLHPKLQANLEKIGFAECTQIQEQGIPIVRKGKDLAGLAQTGTGKTGAFLIPLIDRLLKAVDPDPSVADSETVAFNEWKKKQYCLVLVPTRELAEQVQENAKKFLAGTGLSSVSIYGGTTYEKQVAGLKEGVEFVIATPGRFIDLYKEHVADLGLVRAVCFDEADRMFDMGFKDDMKFILKRIPRDRQFLVFSATLNFDVLNTAYEYGADPVEVNISRDQAKAENVKDQIMHVGQDDKPRQLLSLLKKFEPRQTIIFSNFKHNVERISQFLNNNGIPAVGISSLLTQAQRNRVMEQFKAVNDRNIMVATDVAARGLDILGVDMVINFDLPDDPENYVHRIGRTGRAGATGQAFSMVGDRDVEALQRIEEYLKHKVDALWMEEADLVADFKPFPRDEGRRGPRPGGGGGGRFEKRGEGGGGRGPRREGGDRGPRREGGGPDRGPRREGGGPDRDRGPRRDGPARDGNRGPRPQHAGGGDQHRDRQRGRHQQPEGGSDPQQPGHNSQANGRPPQRHGGGGEPRRHQGGGRHPGDRNRDRGPRRDGEQRHGQSGGGPRGDNRGRGGQHGGRPQGAQQRHGQRPGGPRAPQAAVVASKGIGSKVSGFFKKLFGKES